MLKIFLLPVQNSLYKLPKRYFFVAPLGVGTKLAHLLSTPSALRKEFLIQLKTPTVKKFKELDDNTRSSVIKIANNTDFSIFTSIEVRELLDQHKQTPYYIRRFGGGLPARSKSLYPPSKISHNEAVYVYLSFFSRFDIS